MIPRSSRPWPRCCASARQGVPLVVDPVMAAKGGARLIDPDAVEALKEQLIPRATVLTPNLPEAEILCGSAIADVAAMRARGRAAAAARLPGGTGQGRPSRRRHRHRCFDDSGGRQQSLGKPADRLAPYAWHRLYPGLGNRDRACPGSRDRGRRRPGARLCAARNRHGARLWPRSRPAQPRPSAWRRVRVRPVCYRSKSTATVLPPLSSTPTCSPRRG